jgi:3-oxoacyl-[acyl-carrier-protein] synthase-3
MRKAASLLNIPSEKMIISIDKIGNCISGTIPITIHHAFESGKMKKGALVLLSAAGAGYTAGAALYRCL